MVNEPSFWTVSGSDLTDFMKLGLPVWHDLLTKDRLNQFEASALEAVALFTRGATKGDLSDRLLNTFAAVESLLLKDSQEPLTVSISDRLALVVGTTPDQREEHAKTCRDAYSIRSKFIHHGSRPEDTECIESFLKIVWSFFIGRLPTAVSEFTRKQDFVTSVDRLKYL
jgi:hypothetical protein